MSKTDITIEGLDAYVDKLTQSPDKMIERIRLQALKDAETLAGMQRKNCPAITGMLRESIETFCYREQDSIVAGTRTNNDHAVYVEFGTGPNGTEGKHVVNGERVEAEGKEPGHPLDAELGIVRKTEPWRVNIPGVGVRYTNGIPATPFMYESMKQMQPIIEEHFGSAAKEVLR